MKKKAAHKVGMKQRKSPHLELKKAKKTMKEKKKTVFKKPVKHLANVLKKVPARRVDLAKAHVKAKQAGKVVSNESFS